MKFLNFKIVASALTIFFVSAGGLFLYFDLKDAKEQKDFLPAQNKGEKSSDNREKIEQGAHLFYIKINGLDLNVELADTEEKITRGLSGRKRLEENQGMLFAFGGSGFYSFWMKDMNFPLDIIWISDDLKIADITENIQPGSYPRKFYSQSMTQYVLEVNAGWARNHKIEIGMTVFLIDIFPNLKTKPAISDKINESSGVSPNVLEADSEVAGESIVPVKDSGKLSAQSRVVLLDAPFTSQAPFGGWSDMRRENACEEASALMAMAWVRGEKLTPKYADQKMLEISDYEKEVYGDYHDTSAEDTVKRIFNDYFKYQNVGVVYDIGVKDIIKELQKGNLVIVPVNGQKVKNPYYTPPGPVQHMMVVVGYDYSTKEFITNDPGTRHGEKYRYKEDVFEVALQDYLTGEHKPIAEIKTAMIVVEK